MNIDLGDVTLHVRTPAPASRSSCSTAIGWMTAALVPERIASLTALSVGHPASFRSAGWAQREKSWYMLLFQFPGVAEQWLSADGFRNLRDWSRHPDIEPVA
jgi:pimeloyl-ACP methyl ester carboxylesterase